MYQMLTITHEEAGYLIKNHKWLSVRLDVWQQMVNSPFRHIVNLKSTKENQVCLQDANRILNVEGPNAIV